MTRLRALFLAAALVAAVASPAFAQPVPADQVEKEPKRADVFERTPPIEEQIRDLRHALTRLPIAAGLACVLAFRPRRKGTPERQMVSYEEGGKHVYFELRSGSVRNPMRLPELAQFRCPA